MATYEDTRIDIKEDSDLDLVVINMTTIPAELQERIDVSNEVKTAESIRILVTGKTGSGKSTLVCGLLGVPIDKKNEPSQVVKYEIPKEGVKVIIWDTPGLQDGSTNQESYLQQMKEQCSDRDLTVYCIRISDTRFVHSDNNPDVQAMKKLTKTFGSEFWKNSIIALTYANTLLDINVKWKQLPVHEQAVKFEHRIEEWAEQVRKILQQDVQIHQDIVKTIGIIPTGHHQDPHLPSIKYWLSNCWILCANAIESPNVRKALVSINMNRFKTEDEVKEDDFFKEAQHVPIVITQQSLAPILPAAIAGVAGGTIVGAFLGLFSGLSLVPLGFFVGSVLVGVPTYYASKVKKKL